MQDPASGFLSWDSHIVFILHKMLSRILLIKQDPRQNPNLTEDPDQDKDPGYGPIHGQDCTQDPTQDLVNIIHSRQDANLTQDPDQGKDPSHDPILSRILLCITTLNRIPFLSRILHRILHLNKMLTREVKLHFNALLFVTWLMELFDYPTDLVY